MIDSDEAAMIEMMTQMTWNKNLRKTMAKQLSLQVKFDPPLIRALIYYITQSVSRSGKDYDKIENFTFGEDGTDDAGDASKEQSTEYVGGGIAGIFGKRGEDVTVKDLATKSSLTNIL